MSNRLALRAQTASHHAYLDSLSEQFDLSDPYDYAAFLSWHAALVPALERHLEHNGILAILPDWAARRRRHALVADLGALGMTPAPLHQGLGAVLARTGVESVGHCQASLWGIAYVLEGSRLGGSVLKRSLSPHNRAVAAQYLSHGSEKRLWPRFVDALDRTAFSSRQFDTAARSASAVFMLFSAANPFESAPARTAV